MEIDTKGDGEKKKKRTRREKGGRENKAYMIEEYPMSEIDPRTVAYEYSPEGGGPIVLQPVPVRHSAPQPAYMTLQTGGMAYAGQKLVKPVVVKEPHDYLLYNIFACCCCCWITGLIGIIFSLRTRNLNKMGDPVGARSSSDIAMALALASFALGIFGACIIAVGFAVTTS